MSNKVMNLVFCAPIEPPARKLVALSMADHCNDAGGGLRLALGTIAIEASISRDQARRYVNSLIVDGLLERTAHAAGGAPGTVPHYRINLPAVQALADAAEPTSDLNRIRVSRGLHELPTGSTDATPQADDGEGVVAANETQTGCMDATPSVETGSAHATPTGSTGATPTGGMDATPQPETGGMDAADGLHTRRGGVAPTPRRVASMPPEPSMNQIPEPNTGTNTRARKPRAAGFDALQIELPDWLPIEAWAMWVTHRQSLGTKATVKSEDAARLLVKKLAEYRSEGHDPVKVIEHSVANGWQGLYPAKDGTTLAAGRSGRAAKNTSNRHTGFDKLDYSEGVNPDGTIPA